MLAWFARFASLRTSLFTCTLASIALEKERKGAKLSLTDLVLSQQKYVLGEEITFNLDVHKMVSALRTAVCVCVCVRPISCQKRVSGC